MTRWSPVLPFVTFMFCWVATTGVVAELISRTLPAKPATITKPPYESRLSVKFCDDLKVRAVAGDLTSAVGADLSNVEAVQVQFALSFEQLIPVPQATLDFLETRAAERSGVAQPDLAGMMSVYGAEETIENATGVTR